MRWLWIASENDANKFRHLIPLADVVLLYCAEVKHGTLKLLRDNQVICVFAEAVQDTEQAWSHLRNTLLILKCFPNYKIVMSPTDPRYSEVCREIGAANFQFWSFPTWALNYAPSKQKETFFMFYCNEPADKGQDAILELLGKVPIVAVGVWKFSRGFIWLDTMLSLQARSFALLHPSRSDSVSRTMLSGMWLEQIPILLLTEAAYLRTFTFGFRDDLFFRSVPIAASTKEFCKLVDDAFMHPQEFIEAWTGKVKAFLDKHTEFWHPAVLWQRWKDTFGFNLPADLAPLHHIWWAGLDNIIALPDGPWKHAELSLNFNLKA